jgi:sugar phosphate isomerase/epimerase
MAHQFRHAMCNEAFEGWPLAEACKAIRKASYTGIEIAPFTLAEKPADITAAERQEYCKIMRSEGLSFVGLHWLIVSPNGLHVSVQGRAGNRSGCRCR